MLGRGAVGGDLGLGRRGLFVLLRAFVLAWLAAVTWPAVTSFAETITVTSAADPVFLSDSDGCTLREAIMAANQNAPINECAAGEQSVRDLIVFAILPFDGTVKTITVQSIALPLMTAPTEINGYTQDDAVEYDPANGVEARLRIEINGQNTSGGIGIGSNSIVRGLIINRVTSNVGVPGPGIYVTDDGHGATIAGNFIGVNATGTAASANRTGIFINGAQGVTIGGLASKDRNIVSGNLQDGIRVRDAGDADTGANLLVQGNYIGTDVTGTAAIANGAAGIAIVDAHLAIVGGNLISGNTTSGISIAGEIASDATVQGNLIGTDIAGTAAIPNATGISVVYANRAEIGGTTAVARNVVSGNTGTGIVIEQAEASETVVHGNYIGTDVTGTLDLGNNRGVVVHGAPLTVVGGTSAGDRNVISGNTVSGIEVLAAGAADTTIQGNYVGVDAAGSAAIPNGSAGVSGTGILVDGAPRVAIGGTVAGARNVVSGNGLVGISIQNTGATDARIQGNYVGLSASGAVDLGNGSHGIQISGASSATVGGAAGARNRIAFNAGAGVSIASGTGNAVRGNEIFANDGLGIDLGTAGFTDNDPNDADPGANNLQNFPVLTNASVDGGTTRVAGTLNSTAETTFDLHFYANPECDPSGYGEGQNFLGSTSTTTDSNGNATFAGTALLPAAASSVITATATTSPGGDTSEFSACQPLGAPGVTVSATTVAVAEGGATSSFTVALTTVPSQVVTIGLTGDTGQVSVAPPSLTFQPDASALTAQTVTVGAVDDGVQEGAHSRQITFDADSSDTPYEDIAISPVTVTIADNDTAGFIVSRTSGLVTTEAGGTDTFTLRLASVPTVAVTIPVSSSDISEGTVSTDSLVFQPDNSALNPQTVTVTGMNDGLADGNVGYAIVLGTVPGSEPTYSGQDPDDVTVTNQDDDAPGFVVSPTTGLTTTEAGGTATFTVRLRSQPVAPVTVAITSSDTTEGTVSADSLTFAADASAVSSPQTVTVTGVQDALADGNVAYTIVLGPVTTSDPDYGPLDPANVAATNADDETGPALTINDPPAAAEGDGGTTTMTFTVTLSPPSGQTVTVQFATQNGTATGGTACGAGVDYVMVGGQLTFQPSESQKTTAVTVCADTLTEGRETLLVDLSGSTNATIGDGQGQGTIADDDAAGVLTFSAATAQIAENAGSVTLTVQRGGIGPARAGQPPSTAPGTAAPRESVPSGSVRANPVSSPAATSSPIGPAAISAVSVAYATANGTASAGLDYAATSGTLNFGVGETTKTIAIPILSDNLEELPETFTVTLSAPTGAATLGATTTTTVTISDVDTTACQTTLSVAVPVGSTVLPVVSRAGCNVGDTIAIDPGQPNEERGLIVGFGSIVIQQPTTQAHAAGAVVIRVAATAPPAEIPPPAAVPPAATPPPALQNSPGDDDTNRPRRETEDERRQRERTNRGGKDDVYVEGSVIETRCDLAWPSIVIANRDGAVEVKLLREAQKACRSIKPGDYLEADGEKQHEYLFHADGVEIRRNGERVR
jgi:CSLREA domain-containing protein